MPHTYTNLLFHVIFATKERYPFIVKDLQPRFYEYSGGTIRGLGGISLEIGGIEDHVHFLVKLKPTMNISKFLQDLKPNITNWAKREVHPKFEWQIGYGAFTIGESQIENVRRYIQNQETHHKNLSFDDEFKDLLRLANMDFDEKFLWK